MKKTNRITAALMCAVIALSSAACGGSGSSAQGSTTNAPVADTTTTTTVNDDIENPVDVGDITLDIKEADISGTELSYLGCYDITTAGDVKPAYKYFQENYGANIKCSIVGDNVIMETLSTKLSAGDSPDLVDMRDNTFPSYIAKNTYEPLDDYMDLDAPQWKDIKQYIEQYAINGRHYYFPWVTYVNPIFLCYNRGVFEEYGLDDPKELYEANEWTWDTFYDCMVGFVDKSPVEDALGIYGLVGTSMINTTGKAAVSFENNQLVNNLKSVEVERAQNFLEKIRKEGLSKFTYGDTTDNTTHLPVIDGNAAFHSVGDWKIADYSKQMRKNEDLDIFFVPYPRDPSADNYYLTLDNFGYLVPAGSKNVEAACIFINCVRMSKTDEALKETTRESIMKNKKYTDEQFEFWSYFQDSSNFENLVIDYSTCFETTVMNDVMNPMLEDTLFDRNSTGLSWTTMRENNIGNIDAQIADINAMINNQ